MWHGKRVLVTGAGGFIGSHLTERLAQEGAKVRAFVHYNALGNWGWLDTSSALDDLDVVLGDVTDRDSVRAAMEGMEVVFHLAALIAIPFSYQSPYLYLRTNIEGTMNVLQAARECQVPRVVHTSTSEVYGTARFTPITEAHPLQGQSPYAASKIGADKMAEAFHASFDVPVVTVRPFNTYGPRQSARAVIPTIISQLLHGDTVRLGHLHPTRDLNYVTNTVDGFLLAATTPAIEGKTIHLGSGREISIGDLAMLIAELMGKKPHLETEAVRQRPQQSEVARLVSDSTLAATLLGWQPRVSLEEGLRSTIAWMQQHQERYRSGGYII